MFITLNLKSLQQITCMSPITQLPDQHLAIIQTYVSLSRGDSNKDSGKRAKEPRSSQALTVSWGLCFTSMSILCLMA